MIKTKQVTIWVCDNCGYEQSYEPDKCNKCGQHICYKCTKHYLFTVERGIAALNLVHEGLRLQLCPADAEDLESKLVELGFTPFSPKFVLYDEVSPV